MGLPEAIDIRTLVHDHYQFVFGYAYRLSGTVADAEDLTQETFCKAQQKLQQLRSTESARGWLCMIVRNEYLTRRRSHDRNEVSFDLFEGTDYEGVVPREDEVDVERLQNVVDQLPDRYKTPIVMFYFEELSYREISERLEIPQGTVMSRLARAKSFLRTRLCHGVVIAQNEAAGD